MFSVISWEFRTENYRKFSWCLYTRFDIWEHCLTKTAKNCYIYKYMSLCASMYNIYTWFYIHMHIFTCELCQMTTLKLFQITTLKRILNLIINKNPFYLSSFHNMTWRQTFIDLTASNIVKGSRRAEGWKSCYFDLVKSISWNSD